MTIKFALVKDMGRGNVRIEQTTGIRLCCLGKFNLSECFNIEEVMSSLPDGAVIEISIPEFCPRCKQPMPFKEAG